MVEFKNKKIKYTRLYTTENGDSDFEDKLIVLDQHPEAKEALISEAFNTQYLKFLSFRVGSFFDSHTAPCRQFILHLKGQIEIEVSSGEKRVFTAGDLVLAEDITGKGHITKILGAEEAQIAVSPIEVQK